MLFTKNDDQTSLFSQLSKILQKKFSIYVVKNKNKYCGLAELRQIDIFLDLGANKGGFTLKLPELCNLSIRHAILVEPDPRYEVALKNLIHKKVRKVSFEACCVSNNEGEAVFNIYEDGAQNSLLKSNSTGLNAIEIEVMCTTGEKLIEKYSISENRINVLKLDLQGSEADVLLGFGHHLSKFKIIICEIPIREHYRNQSQLLEIFNILSSTHCYVGNLSEVYSEDGSLDYMNAVFAKYARK